VAFAVGVLALVAVEISGHKSWPVVLLQALLIVGIIVSSAFDLRDPRRRRASAHGPTSE
jgi:uncharacterized membrane protein YoaK (UPF0700 family)